MSIFNINWKKIIKRTLYTIGGLFIFLVVLAIIVSPNSNQKKDVTIESASPSSAELADATKSVSPTSSSPSPSAKAVVSPSATAKPTSTIISGQLFTVVKVVDGDTIDVDYNGKTERIRYIGIDTPETVDPRKPVQCFGKEASNKNKELVLGKQVRLEKDVTERDRYGRLLRYVYVGDTFINYQLVRTGYATVYTYPPDVKYDQLFRDAQTEARNNNLGLWGACQSPTPTTSIPAGQTPVPTNTPTSCTIKGNISSTGEKIYHVIGCASYDKTVIDESTGERWFCSEQEALNAGWRKALNCN